MLRKDLNRLMHIHSFIQQYLFIINPVPSTIVDAGPTDAMPVRKETDQMLTTPSPPLLGTTDYICQPAL